MAEIDLKAYTTRAKELESAIYTQKRLMDSQETIIKKQHPKAPQKKQITPPEKPKVINNDVELIAQGEGVVWFISALAAFVGVLGLIAFFIWASAGFEGFGLPVFVCLVFGAIGVFMIVHLVNEYKERVEMNKNQQRWNNEAQEEYPVLLEQYHKEVAKANENYQKAINGYNINVSKYNQRYSETMSMHNSALSTLEKALEQLYDENVIFPKYRNFVAITTINEYFLSGRCDKLEGPDGAYNLYEMELRQNIIIAQLSNIIDNLEQIRSNQYSLYEELQKSNCTINEILSETRRMKETAKLTAYFAGVTALAETLPKYYHGIIM